MPSTISVPHGHRYHIGAIDNNHILLPLNPIILSNFKSIRHHERIGQDFHKNFILNLSPAIAGAPFAAYMDSWNSRSYAYGIVYMQMAEAISKMIIKIQIHKINKLQ